MRLILLLTLLTYLAAEEIYQGYTGYWQSVVATAYSPHDAIDSEYRATKGKWLHKTAYQVDVRTTPYGIAAPAWVFPDGTKLIIPAGHGYLDSRTNRVFKVDDTGGIIRQRTRETGTPHIDLRYKTEYSAKRFGIKVIPIFVVTGVAP